MMRARKGRFASWVGDNDKNDHTTNDNDKIAEKIIIIHFKTRNRRVMMHRCQYTIVAKRRKTRAYKSSFGIICIPNHIPYIPHQQKRELI